MKKRMFFVICLLMTVLLAVPASARRWQQTEGGIRYVDEDGEWLRDTWEWIDDDWDGIAECYFFDSNGFRVENGVTPDHYTVNAKGQWTENGHVQTKTVSASPSVSIQPAGSLIRSEEASETINLTRGQDFSGSGEPAVLPPDRLKKEKFEGFKWVVSTQNKKYHIIGCGDVNSIPKDCRFYSDDSAWLRHAGFRACTKCAGRVKD